MSRPLRVLKINWDVDALRGCYKHFWRDGYFLNHPQPPARRLRFVSACGAVERTLDVVRRVTAVAWCGGRVAAACGKVGCSPPQPHVLWKG